MHKYILILVVLSLSAILVGCQSELERAAEATVEEQQEKIDTFFDAAEAHVVAATELANALPSQQAKADLLLQDLEEINKRLNEAVEMEADAKVAALEGIEQMLETVQANVQETVDTAVDQLPEEAQDALRQLQGELEDLQKKIQDEVESVKAEVEESSTSD